MGYTLLWLESLCAALFLLATIAALAAHARKARMQKLLPLFAALALVAAVCLVTAFVGNLHFGTRVKVNGFGQLLAWSILFVLGTCVLLVLGMKKGTENSPAARSWPLRKLLYAFTGLAVVTWITFANLDTAMKMQLTSLRTEVGARILALAPARVPESENAAPFYLDAFELMRRHECPAPAHEFLDLTAPAPSMLDTERSVRLERGLQSLPADQRELIALKIDGGLTFAEIALILAISPNTAASRYRYALEKLRTVLEA